MTDAVLREDGSLIGRAELSSIALVIERKESDAYDDYAWRVATLREMDSDRKLRLLHRLENTTFDIEAALAGIRSKLLREQIDALVHRVNEADPSSSRTLGSCPVLSA